MDRRLDPQALDGKKSRLRSTFYGHVGDTGTPTSCYYFFAKGRARERLTHSEELYRAAFSSRSVVVRTPTTAIGGPWLSPGMTIGFDNREILPPFFPVLHAEDSIWATATWLCCSHSVSGHLPFVLHHDSGHGKRIHQPDELTDDRRATVFEFAMIVRSILFGCAPPEHLDSAERIRHLGRRLSAFAARPAQDFVRALRLAVQHSEAGKLTYLQELLREEEDAPDYWREDLEKYIAHTREALTHEDFDIPFELKEQRSDAANRELMQALLAQYGALLEDWPEIFAAAARAPRRRPHLLHRNPRQLTHHFERQRRKNAVILSGAGLEALRQVCGAVETKHGRSRRTSEAAVPGTEEAEGTRGGW